EPTRPSAPRPVIRRLVAALLVPQVRRRLPVRQAQPHRLDVRVGVPVAGRRHRAFQERLPDPVRVRRPVDGGDHLAAAVSGAVERALPWGELDRVGAVPPGAVGDPAAVVDAGPGPGREEVGHAGTVSAPRWRSFRGQVPNRPVLNWPWVGWSKMNTASGSSAAVGSNTPSSKPAPASSNVNGLLGTTRPVRSQPSVA